MFNPFLSCERTNKMKYAKMLGRGLLVAVLTVTGCSQPSATTPPAKDTGAKKDGGKKDDHTHGQGPNGGVVFDLGKNHAEFTVDHDKKECTVLVLGPEEKNPTPKPVAAKDLTVTTKETKTKDGKVVPPMTIKLLPKDDS